jgi:MFS family permease
MKKNGVYYGWWILLALIIAYAVTNGVILNTLPLFYPELIGEFSWTQDQVTRPAQLLFLLVAIFSPFVGYLMDKISIKRMMMAGTLFLLGGFATFAHLSSLKQLMQAYMLFAVGITLAGIIPSMKIITNWFVKNRGMAVGLLLVGSSLGGAVFNPLAGRFISAYDWRGALIILGIITAVLIIIPLIFLVKEQPERLGPEEIPVTDERLRSGFIVPTLGSAAKTGNFYLLMFITGAMWFIIVGVIQHQALIIEDLNTGISSSGVLGVFFLCSVLGKIIFGKLSDHFPKQRIMLLSVINLAAGTFLLTILESNPAVWLWIYAMVFGIGFSGTFTMIQLLVAEYYSGPSYGRILGVFTMFDTLAGVGGILTLGKLRTLQGTYHQAFLILLFLSLIAAVCVLLLRKKETPND